MFMDTTEDPPLNGSAERVSLGEVTVPISFGDQIITSLLFNHDANPVHHKPEHAMQWMLGLLSGTAISHVEDNLAKTAPEERMYALGTALLKNSDQVVMPGAVLAALSYEHFVPPEEHCISVTTVFTYPLLVPTKGAVNVRLEGYELTGKSTPESGQGKARHLLIEAHGPSLTGRTVRLLKMEALTFPSNASAEVAFELLVKREFERLTKLSEPAATQPGISHPASISGEDGRRYARMVERPRPITPLAWQAKIPRVLTEVIDYLRHHDAYQKEVKAYYAGREDEAERHRAIERYVRKEIKYHHTREADLSRRVEELAGLTQQLYARQHTVFDPRFFTPEGPAVKPSTPFTLDLKLFETRLRRGIHRFFTGGRMKDQQVFMGEALVTGQPLVTRELANFLCEINYSFNTLRLFDYHSSH